MRLINVDTFELQEFLQPPDYAILSHTWETDEVLFKDMEDLEKAKKKAGFRKIQLCCEEAKRDELQWVWVDTCCIDKSSSSELSENINRMYDYYAGSTVCYVYLSDVRLGDQHDRKPHGPRSADAWGKAITAALRLMEKSVWATRGWTLQELIAPFEAKFFSQDWELITSKNEWRLDDLEIDESWLDIPMAVLLRICKPTACSVAQRMSWAANRNTTREEDIAYCLLGIFNVRMAPLYGEGVRAFRRLQEEILRTHDDSSVLAWENGHCNNHFTPLGLVSFSSAMAASPTAFASRPSRLPTNIMKSSPFLTPPTLTSKGLFVEVMRKPLVESDPDLNIPQELIDIGAASERFFLVAVAIFNQGEEGELALLHVYLKLGTATSSGASDELLRMWGMNYMKAGHLGTKWTKSKCFLTIDVDHISDPNVRHKMPITPDRCIYLLPPPPSIGKPLPENHRSIQISGLKAHPDWRRTCTMVGVYPADTSWNYAIFGLSTADPVYPFLFGPIVVRFCSGSSICYIGRLVNTPNLMDHLNRSGSSECFIQNNTKFFSDSAVVGDFPKVMINIPTQDGPFYQSRRTIGEGVTMTMTISGRLGRLHVLVQIL